MNVVGKGGERWVHPVGEEEEHIMHIWGGSRSEGQGQQFHSPIP